MLVLEVLPLQVLLCWETNIYGSSCGQAYILNDKGLNIILSLIILLFVELGGEIVIVKLKSLKCKALSSLSEVLKVALFSILRFTIASVIRCNNLRMISVHKNKEAAEKDRMKNSNKDEKVFTDLFMYLVFCSYKVDEIIESAQLRNK